MSTLRRGALASLLLLLSAPSAASAATFDATGLLLPDANAVTTSSFATPAPRKKS